MSKLFPFTPILVLLAGFAFILHMMGFWGHTPKVGEIYVTRSNPNPWGEQARYVVIDVKGDRVLWAHQYMSPMPCKFTVMRSMYKCIGTTTNIPPYEKAVE